MPPVRVPLGFCNDGSTKKTSVMPLADGGKEFDENAFV